MECGTCCQETEMLLSKKDIERLQKKGFSIKFFARNVKEGYITLRNLNGHCVFFDVKNIKCKVYRDRPIGCRLYPIIFDEAKGVIVDKLCPAHRSWTENNKKVVGKKVIRLLKKIDREATQRSSS
ncbi:MAG: YkgJ family cysteine cluster protein [Candidatus Bathyarchaeota archaeon]|nr:YkgJ family cysteine cluster protein [Candidatus Bathyarchaeota archaeon]